ncbi:MAG: thiamine diphosphokinase [Synergistaceae bacterium]|jgi:thiamine pyrophosphokinase|nr:thiamine diphosphokinase [Synergistaceae bacterium]
MGTLRVAESRDVAILSDAAGAGEADRALFLLGGRPPDVSWMCDFVSRNSPRVWAVDRGVASCRAADVAPGELVGDRDSSTPDDWQWALSRGAHERLYDRDKDRTDFQLALSLFGDELKNGTHGGTEPVLILSGCFGGALDHLVSVLDTIALYENALCRCMIDETEGVFFIYPGREATVNFSRPPEAVSLISMTDSCDGVGVSGVKWPLDGVRLERKTQWAVSNEMTQTKDGLSAKVRCRDGILAFYWRF